MAVRPSALNLALWTILCAGLFATPARADLEDVIRAQQERIQKVIERFKKFTSDKNVMGEAITPDGNTVQAPDKTKFDADGAKLLTFQSELTYHKQAFDVVEEEKEDENGEVKVEKLYGFVSPHGKESEAGGSSELERAVYGLHKQFNKEEEQDKPREEGVEFKSIFKVTTKKVQKQDEAAGDAGGSGAGGGLKKAKDDGEDNEDLDVARWELRDEAIQAVKKIGENSFETVKKSAKDDENEGLEEAMANGVLLREAGSRGLKALQAEALNSLSQRRFNRGIRDGALPERVQLWQDAPTCEAWSQQAAALVEEAETPEGKEARQKELQRMTDQCKNMTTMNYKEIMPRFVEEDSGNGESKEQLQSLGVNKEDARERDLRVQLNINEKFGMSANEVQNNWGYGEQDLATTVNTYDAEGNQTGETQMTPEEVLNTYNQQLQKAKETADAINAQLPEQNRIDTSQTLSYQIQKGQKAAWEITSVPDRAKEDFNISVPSVPLELQTYEDVVEQ